MPKPGVDLTLSAEGLAEMDGELVATIMNNGNQAAGAFTSKLTQNGNDVQEHQTNGLAPGASETVRIPRPSLKNGTNNFVFIVDSNGDVQETNEGNNQSNLSIENTTLSGRSLSAADGTTPAGGGEVAQGSNTADIGADGTFTINQISPTEQITLRNTPNFYNKITMPGLDVNGVFYRIPRSINLNEFNAAHRNGITGGEVGIQRAASCHVEGRITPFEYILVRPTGSESQAKIQAVRTALNRVPDLTGNCYSIGNLQVVEANQGYNTENPGEAQIIIAEDPGLIYSGGARRFFDENNLINRMGIEFHPSVLAFGLTNLIEHEFGHGFGAPGHNNTGIMNASGGNFEPEDAVRFGIVYRLRVGNTSPDRDPGQ